MVKSEILQYASIIIYDFSSQPEDEVGTYGMDEIESITMTQQTDHAASYVPCGELHVTIDDSAAGISDLLQYDATTYAKYRVDVYLGISSSSNDKRGSFWIDSINHNDDEKSVTIIAYDILYRLGLVEYQGTEINTGLASTNLYGHAWDVWGAAHATGLIDMDDTPTTTPSMLTTFVTGYIPKTSIREAFRLVAEASGAALCIRNGIVSFIDSVGVNLTGVVIAQDDIVDGTSAGKRDSTSAYISAIAHEYSISGAQQQVGRIDLVDVPADSTISVYIPYDVAPVYNPTYILSAAGQTLTQSARYYADHMTLTMTNSGNTDISTFVTVIGTPYDVSVTPHNTGDSLVGELITIDNPLANHDQADTIGAINDSKHGKIKRSAELFGKTCDIMDVVRLGSASSPPIIVERTEVTISNSQLKFTIEGTEAAEPDDE